LHHGQLVTDGTPEETIEQYHALLALKEGASQSNETETAGMEVKGPASTGEKSPVIEHEGGVHPPSVNDGEPIEREGLIPEESAGTEYRDGSIDQEAKMELDEKRLRIIEVQDPEFFSGDLFFNTFGQHPPTTPTNFAAIYMDSKNPSAFYVLGFIHIEQMDEIGLVGGLCIEKRWQGKGLEKMLLNFVDHKKEGMKAFFVYTNDPRLPAECGYESLPNSYLMVKWFQSVSPEEKERLTGDAMAIGPF